MFRFSSIVVVLVVVIDSPAVLGLIVVIDFPAVLGLDCLMNTGTHLGIVASVLYVSCCASGFFSASVSIRLINSVNY